MKKQVFLFCIVALLFATSCKKENTELLPTIENLSGVWQASDYKLNGSSATGVDFSNNYFLFGTDNSYSARVGAGDTEDYSFGSLSIFGKNISLAAAGSPNETFIVEGLTKTGLNLSTKVGNDIYTTLLTKVNSPTTYRVSNKTAYTMIISSYYYDTEMRDFSYHGTQLKGTIATDKVFTKRSKINLGGSYSTLTFITLYPQTIRSGQENILVLSDTTSIYHSQSSQTVPLSKINLKSILLKDKMTLKEAISKL